MAAESLPRDGELVPYTINVGFLLLSFLVSLLGSGATLELINRHTSRKGWHNHLLLVGAAISMGGIAIWSMHFVGNRAVELLDGEPLLQIKYSAGLTVASFFVPIVVLLLAFFATSGNNSAVSWWRIVVVGTVTGSAVCAMHYIGDLSVSNYKCVYNIGNIVGAAIIAVSASCVALALFFVFRATWTASWWKRIACAIVLAVAVSGMHWCAALGTKYRLKPGYEDQHTGVSRDTTVVAVICLSVAASALMIGTAILTARTRKGYAARAQQIALAAAIFDSKGRILVSTDGLLPSEIVQDEFPQRTQDDIFSTAHPLFHWMYRASRNWSSVYPLLGWMQTHLENLAPVAVQGRRGARGNVALVQEDGQLVENHEILFREMFCLAASTLASRLSDDLLNVGTLWDEIFSTGSASRPVARLPTSPLDSTFWTRSVLGFRGEQDEFELLEKGHSRRDSSASVMGRGSLMFLVRHVTDVTDVERLEAAGFRFAEPSRVMDMIKSSMQIKTERFEERLRDMAISREPQSMLDPGVHLGLFAVRARIDKWGFDVLVNRADRASLPSVRLPGIRKLETWQREFLRMLDDVPIPQLLKRLDVMEDMASADAEFVRQLRMAVEALREQLGDTLLDKATLSSKVVQVPCQPRLGGPLRSSNDGDADKEQPTATLITLHLVVDIHSVRVRGGLAKRCVYVPLQFFKVCQLARGRHNRHHAAFSRALHREMGAALAALPARPSRVLHSWSPPPTPLGNEADLEKGGDLADAKPVAVGGKQTLLGGIMVSQEIEVDVHAAEGDARSTPTPMPTSPGAKLSLSRTPSAIMRGLRGKRRTTQKKPSISLAATAGLAAPQIEAVEQDDDGTTFVDEIFAVCVDKRS